MHLNWDKFVALVHYICDKAYDPSVLGAIKLNKVLWYSDVINYLIHGQSISGETYVKRQHGPVAKHLMPAINRLSEERKIAPGKVDHFGLIKREYVSLANSDKSLFTTDEIALIDDAFEYVCLQHTAKTVSEATHTAIWDMATLGEEMPYYTVFATNVGELTEEDIEWARIETAA